MPTPSRRYSLQKLTLCALFAALISVLSPIAIPLGPVPLSLGLLGVLVTAVSLPPMQSTAAVGVFLAIGLCGLPVFSGGGSGAMILVGPTGGYLWSYLLCAPLVSCLSQAKKPARLPVGAFLACLVGTLVCYACGTLQYCLLTHTSPLPALLVCVLPFLPFDLLKAVAAACLGTRLHPLVALKQRH